MTDPTLPVRLERLMHDANNPKMARDRERLFKATERCLRARDQVTEYAVVRLMDLGVPLDDIVLQQEQATGDTCLAHGDRRLVRIHAEYVEADGGLMYNVTAEPLENA